MPSSRARAAARSWSAAAPFTISPPTAPQPKPSSDTSRPVLPSLRFSMSPPPAVSPALPGDKIAGKLALSIIRGRPCRHGQVVLCAAAGGGGDGGADGGGARSRLGREPGDRQPHPL